LPAELGGSKLRNVGSHMKTYKSVIALAVVSVLIVLGDGPQHTCEVWEAN